MGIKSKLAKCVNVPQIKALLWKDVLIKKRQPWMTAVQYLWPCAIFVTIFILRLKFSAYDVDECQFATRELPTPRTLLPFFQTYICTVDNKCSSTKKYDEISEFDNAPITPVVNIVQTFMNEDALYNAIINLPLSANFLETITIVATHPKFQLLEDNVSKLMASVELHGTPVDSKFDIHQLWSDGMTFSKSGTVFCGKPFPRSDNIRFVDRILYREDFNGANQEELDVMPTKYCKQLYLDVTNTNNGKITWNYIKPIIQGKFLYGPINPQTEKIIQNTNGTFLAMTRLKNLIKSVDDSIKKLRIEGEFQRKFLNIVELAKSPFVQMIMANFNVDPKVLDAIFDGLLHDKQVSDIIETIGNIFECFSVDRFIGVDTEMELEEMALKLNQKKLFYGGVYFKNNGYDRNKEFSYTIRMDVDNTPITLENRNRFWFPGPKANFELDMRYHRGFIHIQHMVDQAIIKTVTDAENTIREEEWLRHTTTTVAPTTVVTDEPTIITGSIVVNLDSDNSPSNETEENEDIQEATGLNGKLETATEPAISEPLEEETAASEQQPETTDTSNAEEAAITTTQLPTISSIVRKKRQADFLETILNGPAEEEDEIKFPGFILFGKTHTYTKQFPYPKYHRDNFLTGLYLGQAIQLTFFFALIVQVTNAARNRIWLKESGNSTLMRIMGLQKSSENIAWIVSTFIDFAITFLICEAILYAGGALQTTNRYLLYIFLLVYGACVISFCYMVSAFFSSASIGSVSTVILFLMTYMPYILIVSLDALLGMWSKAAASLSFATAFCYAWRYIMRIELQQRPFSFEDAFGGSMEENEFKFGFIMICVDLIVYAIIGYLYERFKNDEFHEIEKKDMDVNIGGALQNCTKKYDGSEYNALENVSIIFRRGFITCLLGRNGAGKSTIIKLLTGQIAPTNGHVYWPQNWDRITAHEYDERVGLCPQNNILIPNLTAKEHLELYVSIKMNGKTGKDEVRHVMKDLQFGAYENYYSQHLSGGFKRRLNVAIAFICSPNLVILDEPCSGVDTRARKNIWDLISVLRKGRAVALATHYLDEAEHLSDSILIMNEGKVVAEYDPDQLKEQFTQNFELHFGFGSVDNTKAIESINALLRLHTTASEVESISTESLIARIPYHSESDLVNYSPLINDIEEMVQQQQIKNFRIVSSNLENIFNDLVDPAMVKKSYANGHVHSSSANEKIDDVTAIVQRSKLSEFEAAANLFKKRFLHFKRNYRLILCIFILPTLFEIMAMGFMTLRPPGEFDIDLQFSRALYSNSTDVYSIQENDEFGNDVGNTTYEDLTSYCSLQNGDVFGNICNTFDSSEKLFRWVLNTTDDYPTSRYGGISINGSRSAVWYNNNGYHAMPVFLNELNTAYFRSLLNDSDYKITTSNHPLKLDDKELTQSSILQQIADAGISLILLVAFSLVVGGASIYIVNERVNGEKLQQKLSGVSFKTYWGVAFVWDYTVYIIAVLLAVVVFKIFDIPVYTARHNLYGTCLLLLLFGFAALQMVHLCEKLFNDASLANMYILCMNILIAMSTITTIILIDLLDESEWSDKLRAFLNRAFLVLPQHAFADGLLELCKNYVVSEVFQRYYIDTYKSPITTNLMIYHYTALICAGFVFWIANFIVESGMWRSYLKAAKTKRTDTNLESIATSNANGTIANGDAKHKMFDKLSAHQTPDIALKADSLCKTYDGRQYAVKDVTFNVRSGECFGLLGCNGAGKSTVFSMLSGELAPTSGTVYISNRDNGVAYCPQSNALDSLLTVEEIIHFYGKLRRIENISEMTERTLKFFHLLPYRNVLVKNLSGGNRRKLSVAVTCFGSSTNVLMDEPTSDMDPVTRSIVYASINRLLLEKRSVILTSHTITEIDRVCDRIGIMRQGKMIVTAPPQQLKTMYGNRYAITVYYDQIEALTIERDIKKAISNIENLIVHSHCLQFRIKICNSCSSSHENGTVYNNNNETNVSEAVIDDGMVLSDLYNKLFALTVGRGITFTITECLLDQAFECVLDAEESSHSYNNSAYASETPT